MSSVIDSSALLALMFREEGAQLVIEKLNEGAHLSTVNLSEVIAKLRETGTDEPEIRAFLQPLNYTLVEFDEDAAWRAGLLRLETRAQGLSLGDRACLALAQSLGLPVLTADRVWANLDVGVEVILCR